MWTGFVFGFGVGIVATAMAVVGVMRSKMIEVSESPLGFDDTVRALEQGVARTEGWSSPATRDLRGMMAKHGVSFPKRVTLVEMCNPHYASEVLADARHVATLMPCAVAVYEDDAGAVHLAKMNTGLMGKVFGGTIARVMGRKVARDEQAISALVRDAPVAGRERAEGSGA